MVSGASGAARSQKAQQWKGPNTIGTRERAWQKRQRRVETCNAGRAGAHRPSEALHPKRSLDRAAADRAGARPISVDLSKASADECILSRRDSVIVARYEVPGLR